MLSAYSVGCPALYVFISPGPHKDLVNWRRKLRLREVKKFPKVPQLASGAVKT